MDQSVECSESSQYGITEAHREEMGEVMNCDRKCQLKGLLPIWTNIQKLRAVPSYGIIYSLIIVKYVFYNVLLALEELYLFIYAEINYVDVYLVVRCVLTCK